MDKLHGFSNNISAEFLLNSFYQGGRSQYTEIIKFKRPCKSAGYCRL